MSQITYKKYTFEAKGHKYNCTTFTTNSLSINYKSTGLGKHPNWSGKIKCHVENSTWHFIFYWCEEILSLKEEGILKMEVLPIF